MENMHDENYMFYKRLQQILAAGNKKREGFLNIILDNNLHGLALDFWCDFWLPEKYEKAFFNMAVKNPTALFTVVAVKLHAYNFDLIKTAFAIKDKGLNMQTIQNIINSDAALCKFLYQNHNTINASEFLHEKIQRLINLDVKFRPQFAAKANSSNEMLTLKKCFADTMCDNPMLAEKCLEEISLLSQNEQTRIAYAVTDSICYLNTQTTANKNSSQRDEYTIQNQPHFAGVCNSPCTLTSTDMCFRILSRILFDETNHNAMHHGAIQILWEHLKTNPERFKPLYENMVMCDFIDELDALDAPYPLPDRPKSEFQLHT